MLAKKARLVLNEKKLQGAAVPMFEMQLNETLQNFINIVHFGSLSAGERKYTHDDIVDEADDGHFSVHQNFELINLVVTFTLLCFFMKIQHRFYLCIITGTAVALLIFIFDLQIMSTFSIFFSCSLSIQAILTVQNGSLLSIFPDFSHSPTLI